jgi:CBS domain containing-hemolysin-like protein
MIPTNEFFMVEEKEVITEEIVRQIKQKDYSYILIYKEQKNHITGVIKIKDFAVKYLK